ncbi:hypothetical protein CL634_05680 [bacterium]|nr:hypothetical protein [bacterium]|tara:strand:+ start:181 stop:549 length:369 start_codon:yes stop_codon:yes gene_type:complete
MIWDYTEKTESDYHRLIVSQFCEYEKGTYGAKLNEAIKVYQIHPDPEFWEWMFLNCNVKVQCPSYFISPEGLEFIRVKKRLMEFNPKPNLTNVELNGKLGEDKVIKKKKNLLDFIKDGEKEN